jgi:hypothetical protein
MRMRVLAVKTPGEVGGGRFVYGVDSVGCATVRLRSENNPARVVEVSIVIMDGGSTIWDRESWGCHETLCYVSPYIAPLEGNVITVNLGTGRDRGTIIPASRVHD